MKPNTLKATAGNCWQRLTVTMLVFAGAVISASGADAPLFAEGAQWEFKKNSGDGSFKVEADKDGRRIGILEYDFSKSAIEKKPYVLASTTVNIVEGATVINLEARSPIAQLLALRMEDSTGQKHQVKRKITGTGQWEAIKIPLDGKLEHWAGANDGVIHFPVKRLIIIVSLQSPEAKTGKIEFANPKTE